MDGFPFMAPLSLLALPSGNKLRAAEIDVQVNCGQQVRIMRPKKLA